MLARTLTARPWIGLGLASTALVGAELAKRPQEPGSSPGERATEPTEDTVSSNAPRRAGETRSVASSTTPLSPGRSNARSSIASVGRTRGLEEAPASTRGASVERARIEAARDAIRAQNGALMQQPAFTYAEIQARRATKGPNFSFPELRPYLELIAIHAAGILEQRCAFPVRLGAARARPEPPCSFARVSPETRRAARDTLRDVERMAARGYPYRDTWRVIARHICAISRVDHPDEVDCKEAPDGGTSTEYRLERFIENERIVLWPVLGYFPLSLIPRIAFLPVYPIGISLAAFNDYDGIRAASAASFMNHDFSHADMTARRRDEAFALFPPSGWHPPEPEHVLVARAEAVEQAMHNRHEEWRHLAAAAQTVEQSDPSARTLVQGLLTILFHELPFMASCTRESVSRMLARQLEEEELPSEFREMVADFTGVRDEARIRATLIALARAVSPPAGGRAPNPLARSKNPTGPSDTTP